ncbi:hypothetical protein FLA_6152 [Filimonas lacunae]|nr:hypothetical protein FLA_6152 [Filimonas lacunae]
MYLICLGTLFLQEANKIMIATTDRDKVVFRIFIVIQRLINA